MVRGILCGLGLAGVTKENLGTDIVKEIIQDLSLTFLVPAVLVPAVLVPALLVLAVLVLAVLVPAVLVPAVCKSAVAVQAMRGMSGKSVVSCDNCW